MDILKEELKRISVSEKDIEKIEKLTLEIVKKISKKVKVQIGGSLAKGTLIRKKIQDIDIFTVFEKEEDTNKLEGILKKAKLRFEKLHGSRDYFQIKNGNIIFEIIPVVRTYKAENAKNTTDVSLMHVEYVKRKIRRDNKISDEIKLAKAFCYAQGCYGAESYISGFSGYALEILVIYYGSFLGFLRNIGKKKVIDPENFYKKKDIFKELNESKLKSPIILIDPTFKLRNACAGLSEDTFNLFLESAKKFLKNHSLCFFEEKKFDLNKIKKKARKINGKMIKIEFSTEKQKGDIAGTKMKRFFEFIIKEIERKGQKIAGNEFVYSGRKKAEGYLVVKENKDIEIKGPPTSNKLAVDNFKRVRKKIQIKNGFAYAKEKITLKDIFLFLKRFEKEMQVNFKV